MLMKRSKKVGRKNKPLKTKKRINKNNKKKTMKGGIWSPWKRKKKSKTQKINRNKNRNEEIEEQSAKAKSTANEQRRALRGELNNTELDMFIENMERKNILMDGKLGNGEFGEVFKGTSKCKKEYYKAQMRNNNKICAESNESKINVVVKTLKGDIEQKDKDNFITEGKIQSKFNHKNIVRVYGMVTSGDPYLLVMELCSGGELKSALTNGKYNNVNSTHFYKMFIDIAKGMEHIHSKKVVHRDLATRNVLIGRDGILKVADFGLARKYNDDDYEEVGDTKIPLRWAHKSLLETIIHNNDPNTNPSSKKKLLFNEKTDIWSYGVTLIEIYTLGKTPYGEWNNELIVRRVMEGYRLPKPKGCPDKMYEIIQKCWNDTLTFSKIIEKLKLLSSNPLLNSDEAIPNNNNSGSGSVSDNSTVNRNNPSPFYASGKKIIPSNKFKPQQNDNQKYVQRSNITQPTNESSMYTLISNTPGTSGNKSSMYVKRSNIEQPNQSSMYTPISNTPGTSGSEDPNNSNWKNNNHYNNRKPSNKLKNIVLGNEKKTGNKSLHIDRPKVLKNKYDDKNSDYNPDDYIFDNEKETFV